MSYKERPYYFKMDNIVVIQSSSNGKFLQREKEKSSKIDCDGYYDDIMSKWYITIDKDKYLQIKWNGKDKPFGTPFLGMNGKKVTTSLSGNFHKWKFRTVEEPNIGKLEYKGSGNKKGQFLAIDKDGKIKCAEENDDDTLIKIWRFQ